MSAFFGTPGHWRRESVPTIYLEELGLECEIVRDEAGEPVAFVPYRFGEYHIVGMANARAISTVPNLLAALLRATETGRYYGECRRDQLGASKRDDCRCVHCEMKDVIAMALGQGGDA